MHSTVNTDVKGLSVLFYTQIPKDIDLTKTKNNFHTNQMYYNYVGIITNFFTS